MTGPVWPGLAGPRRARLVGGPLSPLREMLKIPEAIIGRESQICETLCAGGAPERRVSAPKYSVVSPGGL